MVNRASPAEAHAKLIDVEVNMNLDAELNNLLNVTRCGGVELDNVVFSEKPIVDEEPGYLETKSFIPHFMTGNIDIHRALKINLQVVAENVEDKVVVTEFVGTSPSIIDYVKQVVDLIPNTEFDLNAVQAEYIELDDLVARELTIKKSDLFIVSDLLADEKKMKKLYNVLSNYTFVLALEKDTLEVPSKYKLFHVITAMSVEKQSFILLKKADTKKENVTFLPITHDSKFNWVLRVLTELQKPRHVTLVSDRQPLCGIKGMVQKLRKQYINKISVIIIDDFHAPPFNLRHAVFTEQIEKNLTFNVLKQGQWGGYYCLSSPKSMNIHNVKLSITTPGKLDSLTWVQAPPQSAPDSLIQVCFAAASLRDAQKAVGARKIDDGYFGMDFSGIDNKGNKVMGLIQGGALATSVKGDPDLLWPIPEHWSLEDAATVPLPYVLAYYCLGIRTKVLRHMGVYVVGGAGALGQACISICLAAGITVFTSVSDDDKKRFLMKLFPQLKESHIGNSRDHTMPYTVACSGQKCHVVINCASGIYREAAMQCTGELQGVFLDVADEDMEANMNFGMQYVYLARTYQAIRLSSIFKNVEEKKALQLMVGEGISSGAVRPLSRVVYPPTELARAFRLLCGSRHRGRVVIRMTDPDSTSNGLNVTPTLSLSSKNSNVVICDEDGLGIELADSLVKKGARKLMVHMKADAVGGYVCTKLAKWQSVGASVTILSDNLQSHEGCVNLLKESAKLGPIEGLFIVQNADTMEKSWEQENFVVKFNKRALVVNNLDSVSRNLCNDLRYFVVITRSSDSITDQFTASVEEKICQSRNDFGLPALILHVDSLKEFDRNTEHLRTKPQSVSAVFKALETSLKLKYNNVVTFNLKKCGHVDFLEKISNVLGVRKIEDVDENLTLNDLRLNEINLEEIGTIIKDTCDVYYPVDKLRKTTILSIKTLVDNLNMIKTNFKGGLGAFYTYIDDDECMATEPMVTMLTKLANSAEKEEELDPKATYLMMIPGFEGHHEILLPICQRLKMQVQVFQLGPDLTNDSVQQMAVNIMKFMKNRFELKSKFYLFGYSFGVNVALELAALIEKEGHVGVVYCLDSSPDALRAQLSAYLGNLTDTELQDTIIQHLYRLMTGHDNPDLKNDLEKAESWPEKVEACVKRLRGLVKYSNQYKRSVLQSAYNRIMTARNYDPTFELESEIVLMKGIPHPDSQKLADDYGLSKFTKHPVKIFHLASDHALALHDSRVANIINKLFEPKVIEEFKEKNLCETYLTRATKIF